MSQNNVPPAETGPDAGGRSASGPEATAPQAAEQPRRIHWRTGAGILLGGLIAESIVFWKYADDDTLRIYITLKFIIPIVGGLLILWWLFRSGFSWRARLIGILLPVLAVGALSLVFRLEGFDGAMRPRFSYRWSLTPEERAARYFRRTAGSGSGAPASADSNQLDWPRFRGARGDGVVRGVSIRTDWESNPPGLVWKHPVGPGWSSFAVVGSRLFTQEQRGDEEAVVCYDAATGEQLWAHLDEARYSTLMGGTGPRATPTVVDSRLYALGATGILNCLDPGTGRRIWSTNILEDAVADNLPWGMAGSPLVYDDVVVVNPGGDQGRSVIVYDRLTGAVRWARGDHRAGYAAPRIETLRGMRQLIIYDAAGVAGCDPTDGTELWRFEWTNTDRINVAQPIVRDESLVLISSGYGTGSALLEIDRENGNWVNPPRTRWRRPGHFKLKFNDAVYKDGNVYGLDEGILACIDYDSGDIRWRKRGGYGHGQMVLIDDDDLLLIQAESGEVVLVEATPQAHREVARFAALDGQTWNHPVVNRGFLYVRNFQETACYDLRPATSAPETTSLRGTASGSPNTALAGADTDE